MIKSGKIQCLCLLILCFTGFSQAFAHGLAPFIENKGQWHEDVYFKTSIPGGDLYVLKNKLKYVFYQGYPSHHQEDDAQHPAPALRMAALAPDLQNLSQAVEISFEGSNPRSEILGENATFNGIHFIKGSGQAVKNISASGQVRIRNLYDGIDLLIYTQNDALKYDLIVQPGNDPAVISMRYKGQNALKLTDGQLEIYTIFGTLKEQAPVVYSQKDHQRLAVGAGFSLTGDRVKFKLTEDWDASLPLIIDPELIFSTYSGSRADNWGFTATYDDEGNLYSGGIVSDTGYPVTTGVFQPNHAGEWDVGILKYDPTGKNLIWATYLGGSFSETPQSIIVNSKGDLIIYGTTSSPDFPMREHSYNTAFLGGDPIYDTTNLIPYRLVGGIPMRNGTDIFLAMLSPDGSDLVGSTFIGGTENDGIIEKFFPLTRNYGDQFRGEVNIDADDNIYVASNTGSQDFPVKNAAQTSFGGGSNDGVLMKFNPDLSDLIWSTFAGGAGMDALYSVKVDRLGNVFAAGGSNSVDFPVTENTIKTQKPIPTDIDGVVIKLSDTGQLLASTYIGTASYNQVYFLELDTFANVYLLGQTQGFYPITEGVYSNPNSGQFIHKITSDLDSTFFSTTIGSGRGTPDFSPTAFLVNECENIFISGWGGNLNNPGFGYIGGSTIGLPVTGNAFQSQTDGTDFYLMVLLQDAKQLLYATYFGEINGRGEHVDGGTSRFDKKGIVYQSVCGGCGGSSGFPTWPPDVWSRTNNSANCNNAAFKFDLASLLARFETDTPDFTNRGIRQGCYPLTLVFLNESLGGENFLWNFGEGTITDQEDSIAISYENPGVYPVVLTATDINTCVRVSQATGSITVFDYEFGIMPDDSICSGEQITLYATGGVNYDWNPKGSLHNSNSQNPVASPDTTATYSVIITDSNGCIGEDSLQIKVIPAITADFSVERFYDCFHSPLLRFTNESENASFFHWDFGDGSTSETMDTEYRYEESDSLKVYQVTLTSGESFCTQSKTVPVSTVTPFIPNFISPNNDGMNDVFEIRTDGPVELNVYNRWGKPVYQNEEYRNTWGGENLASGVYYYEIVFNDKNTRCNGWLQVMY